MSNDLVNDVTPDDYFVEINGKATSEHLGFIEALKVGLKLRQQYPQSDVKVRETQPGRQVWDLRH